MDLLNVNYILLTTRRNKSIINFFKNSCFDSIINTIELKTGKSYIEKMIGFYEFIDINKFKSHKLGDNSILFIKE